MSTPPTPSTRSTTSPRLAWALLLADRGWPVFPLLPGTKTPALHGDKPARPCPRTGACRDGHRGWESLATTDPAVIDRYWSVHPDHNIGLATGPAGLIVLDLDAAPPKPQPEDCKKVGAHHGAQMLAHLAATDHAAVPDTWTVTSPSGGRHLYFRQPPDLTGPRQLRNTRGGDRGGLGGLIDTRAWGGYVVAPGAVTTEGGYTLTDDVAPVLLPGWLATRLTARATAPTARTTAASQVAGGRVGAYVAAAIAGEATRVRAAEPGTHNKAQMVASLALGQLVGAGHLDHATALTALHEAAAGHISGRCGCTETGVSAVFEWGLTAGARNPRHLTTPPTPARGRDNHGSAA